MASDGVWEFLTNEKVKEIVDHYYQNGNVCGAADNLIEESVRQWRKVTIINFILFILIFKEDEVIDDTTTIVIFLDKSIEHNSNEP
jgi:hypothetical protein